jgi:hypothetical protein
MESITMNELVLPIMLGIISSLVATAIFLGLSWLIKNVALPWYGDKIYRGVRLNGEWTRTNIGEIDCLSSSHPLAKLSLKQKGEYVSGIFTHGSDTGESDAPLETYKVKGHISNSFVTITMQPTKNDNIDAASGIFHIFNKDNKLQLRGNEIFIDSEKASVHSIEGVKFAKDT